MLSIAKKKGGVEISMPKVTQLALREAVIVSFICQFDTSHLEKGTSMKELPLWACL